MQRSSAVIVGAGLAMAGLMGGLAVKAQVSIESHVAIRIAPVAPGVGQAMIISIERRTATTHLAERKIGNCVPIAGIGAVRGGDDRHLLLFMRDDTLVSAELPKACAAADFYSGFYIARNADGRLCTGRDALQARSGANCKLKQIRGLVPVADRRAP